MTYIFQDTGGQLWQLGIDNAGQHFTITEVGSGTITPITLNSAGVSWKLEVVGTAPNSTLEIVATTFNPANPTSFLIQSPNGTSWSVSIVNNNLVATNAGSGSVQLITWLGVSLMSKRRRGSR